jgi:hypothetical protein
MLNIELSIEEEIKLFKEELRRFFTKDELDQLAREVGLVQRKGKLKAW